MRNTGFKTPARIRDYPNVINVKLEFGAAGDGVTDDASAIQSAIAAAAVSKSTVVFPPGTYAYGATIFLKSNIRLLGYGATLVRVAGQDDVRPREATGAQVPGLYVTFAAVSRFRYTTLINPYSDWCTIAPDSTYQGPHSNIVIEGLTIEGTQKSAGNTHQLASGPPIAGDVDDCDVVWLDECSDVLIRNVTVPFSAECAVRVSGNTDLTEGGSGNRIRIENLTGDDVGKLIEASENVQSVFINDPVATDCYSHGLRMSNVLHSHIRGGSIKNCDFGSNVYYSTQGSHILAGVDLNRSNNTEYTIRIDGGINVVEAVNNVIHRGRIGRTTGVSNRVSLRGNVYLNEDGLLQGKTPDSVITVATGFVYLPQTTHLDIDELLPVAVDNSAYQKFLYSANRRNAKTVRLRAGLVADFVCSGALQDVVFDDVSFTSDALFDRTTAFNTTTGHLVNPPEGEYQVSMALHFESGLSAGDSVRLVIREVNSPTTVLLDNTFRAQSASAESFTISSLLSLKSTQEYQFQVTATASSVISGGVVNTFLSIVKLV